MLARISRRKWLLAMLLTLGFILVTVGLGYYSNLVIPGNPDHNARYLAEPGTHLDFMSEWDGPHYIYIAQHGYGNNVGLSAFFPLYPLLIRLVMYIVRSPLISALLVSWLCLFGALYFYFKIAHKLFGSDTTTLLAGALLFLLFPTGVFLAATYYSSLLAFTTLAAFYFGLRGKYIYAGLFCLLAAATQPIGIFTAVAVALLLYEAKTGLVKSTVALVFGMAGIGGYMLYLDASMGKPLAFISGQRQTGWLSGHYLNELTGSITAVSLILFVLMLISVIYWWRKRLSFAIYNLLYVITPIIGGNFAGYGRYILTAFPLQFMLLKKFKNSTLGYSVVLSLSTMVWAYFVIHYAAGYTGGS
jgi:hypothetical protein